MKKITSYEFEPGEAAVMAKIFGHTTNERMTETPLSKAIIEALNGGEPVDIIESDGSSLKVDTERYELVEMLGMSKHPSLNSDFVMDKIDYYFQPTELN